MSGGPYKVQTTDGVLVSAGPQGEGFTEEDAKKDADRRNKSAEKLGVQARYEPALRGS